jgi:branched-chain amino acid transport system permease protein
MFISAVFVVMMFIPFFIKSGYTMHFINIGLLHALPAAGLAILEGYTAQLSLCQAVFFGLGGYFVGITANNGFNIWAAIILAPFAVACIALLLGLPSIRLKGFYLVLLTMVFGTVCYTLFMQLKQYTNGPDGLRRIGGFSAFGIDLTSEHNFYYVAVIIVIATVFFLMRLSKSHYGIMMKTVQQNEAASETIGVNVKLQKILAFIISGFIGAIGGAFYFAYAAVMAPDMTNATESILLLAATTIGGMHSIVFSTIGGFVLSLLPEALRPFKLYYMLFFSLIIVLTMIYLPRGVGGLFRDWYVRARQRESAAKKLPEGEVR